MKNEAVKWCHQCPFGIIERHPGVPIPNGVTCVQLQRTVHGWTEAPHIPPADCPLRAGPVCVTLAE